MFFARKRMNA